MLILESAKKAQQAQEFLCLPSSTAMSPGASFAAPCRPVMLELFFHSSESVGKHEYRCASTHTGTTTLFSCQQYSGNQLQRTIFRNLAGKFPHSSMNLHPNSFVLKDSNTNSYPMEKQQKISLSWQVFLLIQTFADFQWQNGSKKPCTRGIP